MLKPLFEIHFYSMSIPGEIVKEIEEHDFQLGLLSDEADFLQNIRMTDIVVLDGYHFDSEYQRKIRKKCQLLAVIDDMVHDEMNADLIINHAPGVTKNDYHVNNETAYALGPEYALIRPSFCTTDAQFPLKNERHRLLICFGGSDVKNLTTRATKIAISFKQLKKITIITGSAFNAFRDLKAITDEVDNVEIFRSVNETEMASLMTSSDVAIVPSSGILFEALALKCVVLSGMYVENQKSLYEGFKQMNAFIDAGTFQKNEIEDAFDKINEFNPIDIVDGSSPERFRNLFCSLLPEFKK